MTRELLVFQVAQVALITVLVEYEHLWQRSAAVTHLERVLEARFMYAEEVTP